MELDHRSDLLDDYVSLWTPDMDTKSFHRAAVTVATDNLAMRPKERCLVETNDNSRLGTES